ncbi:hypothetical protein PspLS_02208 [Pyricularia sp. CBS 133598]|nr:hypothetical protein PspLS_02208 [Pyricularia sp. CBS 133598]
MVKEVCQHCLEVTRWPQGVYQKSVVSIDEILTTVEGGPPKVSVDYSFLVIVASANLIRDCPSQCKKQLTTAFAMPEMWWEEHYRKTNGYFGSETTYDDSTGSSNGINTWSRFLVKKIWEPKAGDEIKYQWLKFNIFTRWLPSTNQMVVLLFDPLPDVKERIYARLERVIPDSRPQQHDHFWVHSRILHDFIDLQHRSVWGIRNHVRMMEKAQTKSETTPNFRHLHDLARHSIHICETLELACVSMDELLEFSKSSSQDTQAVRGTDQQAAAAAASRETSRNRLLFQRNVLRSFQLRAQANKERLQNEIGLAFNNIAQQNALLAVEIGRATRTDGLAVKTIAFVTFAFLPATLICAIFSMPFFELESGTGQLLVSDKFWMYWAVTIPVTLLAPLLWEVYNRLSLPQDAGNTGENLIRMPSGLRNILQKLSSREGKTGDIEMTSFEQR